MNLEIDIDLTQYSITFPKLLEPQIPRDNLISWLCARFSPDRQVIIVQGPDGAGKTTLLAQFAKTYSSRCFSFFIRRDYWALEPQNFLSGLCVQMQRVVGSEHKSVGESYYELEKSFSKLYHRVASKARSLQQPFYFVIDGLEWVPKSYTEKSIIDLLPHDPLDGIYLLASSAPGQEFRFEHYPEPIKFFSPIETEFYLQDIIDKEQAKRIHSACDGMPGYLDQIRREMQSGRPIDEILTDLPKGFKGLLEREWERIEVNNECALDGLAVLAHSETPLKLDTLAEIVSSSSEVLGQCLFPIPLIQTNPNDQTIHFVTDAHRRFVTDKLNNRRAKAEKLLIEYYQQDPFSELSLIQLPVLLKESKRYDVLKSLVNVEYLHRTLQQTQDMSLLRRNARIVADDAYNILSAADGDNINERHTLSKYALVSSIFRKLATETVSESEVDALLSLNDYKQSFAIAHRAILPEDRLQLLASIGSRLKQQEQSIPNELLLNLEHLVQQIDPKGGLRERVIQIAADLFYVHQQAAMDLIEKVAGTDQSGRSMDIILAILTLNLEGKATDSSMEILRSRISDESLQDFARVHSPLVAGLTVEQVLAEAGKIKDTSGRLFLLRSWCNANRKNPEAIRVIDVALEIMTASTDYSPSMRHLRQFAEPLTANPNSDEVYKLVERFDLLKSTTVNRPLEEAIRLELILASAEKNKFEDHAITRLYEIYFGLEDITELDTRCYSLVRILLSLPDIKPDDTVLISELEGRLADDYQTLLDASADHLVLTRRLLAALTNYKPELAVQFSSKLNTLQRREKGYYEILRVYADREPTSIDLSFIENVLGKITNIQEHDRTFVSILKQFAKKEMFSHIPQTSISHLRGFIEKTSKLVSPKQQSYAYAYSLQMMVSVGKDKDVESLFNKLVDAWSKIDQKWNQVQVGFDLVTIVAETRPELARQFLERIKQEREATPLAEGVFIEVYINTLKLAIRTFPDISKSQDRDYVVYKRKLLEAIDQVPSHSMKSQLLAELALRLYLVGQEHEFRELVDLSQKKLENCEDAEALTQTIIQLAPCLFQYNPSRLTQEISQLSIVQRDSALRQVIIYLLSRRPPTDPIDLEMLTVAIKYDTALCICDLLEQMSNDTVIFSGLSQLVDKLVRRDVNRNCEVCDLDEKQALTIARKLEKIAKDKFPNPDNIQHEGYKIASQACIASLVFGAKLP